MLNLIPQSAKHSLRSSHRPLKATDHKAASTGSPSITPVDGCTRAASGHGLRRVQSSVDLRELTFQTWCATRGKRYLEEKRNQQRKQLQAEEETKKLVINVG